MASLRRTKTCCSSPGEIPQAANLTHSPMRNERPCLQDYLHWLINFSCNGGTLVVVLSWSAILWVIPQDRAECELGRVAFSGKSKTHPRGILQLKTNLLFAKKDSHLSWKLLNLQATVWFITTKGRTKHDQHWYVFRNFLPENITNHVKCKENGGASDLLDGGVEGSELADNARVVHRHAEAYRRLLERRPNNWKEEREN